MNDFLKKPLVKVLMLKGEKGETGDVSKENFDNSINNLNDLISNNSSRIDDAQNGIKTANSRIDNLIVSSGSDSSAEVIDARTGYDGTTYDTLGTATRTQASELREDLAKGKIVFLNLFDKTQIVKGKIYNPYVNLSDTKFLDSENGFYCTQKFPCKNGDKIYVSWNWAYILVYNENRKCVQVCNSDQKEYTVNSKEASYFRYCCVQTNDKYVDDFMISINQPLPDYYVRYDESVLETKIVNYVNDKTRIPPLKTRIVINFDAIIPSMEDNIPKLMLNQYGYRFTFNGYSDSTKELLKRGCDVATYSNKSDELPSFDTIDSTSENDILAWDTYVRLAKERQEEKGVYNPTLWACCQLRYGTALEKALKKYGYKIARGSGDENGFDLSGQTYQKVGCVVPTDHTLDYVKTCIDSAIKNNKHLIVLFHKVLDTVPSGDTWDIDKTYFIQIMDYIKSKVDSGLCEIVTARELYHLSNSEDAYNNDYNRLLKSIN